MAITSAIKKYPLITNILRFSNAVDKSNKYENIENQRITQNILTESGTREDLSYIAPNLPKTFNIAAYVNNSASLQNLMHLNVNLNKIEKKPHLVEKLLKLDFNRDMSKYIIFLKDYVKPDDIGDYITKNPMIFYEPLEDLEVRLNYLRSKNFSTMDIGRIISKNPFWLMFSTLRIDRRLGFYQGSFNLSGKEVRDVVTRQPKLITYNLHHVKVNTFIIKEEMGFEDEEIKQLLLNKPKLWMISQDSLLERFNFLHNVIKVSHKTLLKYPEILLFRNFKVKQRHLFLEKLGRSQYDPKKENYVPITALVEGSDVDFCKDYAKSNINDFNIFLKTL